MKLEDFVKSSSIEEPVKLKLKLVALKRKWDKDGRQARYFRAYIGDLNVTEMVAKAIGCNISRAKNTAGCLIIYGSGMDMAFAIQYRIYKYASGKGYHNMFSKEYTLLN